MRGAGTLPKKVATKIIEVFWPSTTNSYLAARRCGGVSAAVRHSVSVIAWWRQRDGATASARRGAHHHCSVRYRW
jgi:hypothetical protein